MSTFDTDSCQINSFHQAKYTFILLSRHSELLEKNGVYADMWQQQLVNQGDGEDEKNEKKGKLQQRRNLSFNNQGIGNGQPGNGSLQSVGRDDVLFQF